ncbi:type II toxin-antitoxin system RelB/DinJ family antitoxin [Rhizobium sp. C4]|uniref:type II toxin-antitoxin system RelB/DinJ family antitoxin n=1 Tax=Rhizobium sp. C4 TaxID=1349800 RepID=UPI003FA69227
MAEYTKLIHIRVDVGLHEEASAVLKCLGLSMSDAISIFLQHVAATQSLPPELKVPNEDTAEALAEARAMRLARRRAAEGR